MKKQHNTTHYLACFVTWLTTLAFCCQFLMVPEIWAALPPSPKTTRFRVPLWILQNGIPITPPLLQEDLAFFADSAPLKIIRQTEPGSPTLLFLAFDLVGDLTTITPAKQAIINQVQELGPEYWVGLILAQETLSVLQEPTRNKKLLQVLLLSRRQCRRPRFASTRPCRHHRRGRSERPSRRTCRRVHRGALVSPRCSWV